MYIYTKKDTDNIFVGVFFVDYVVKIVSYAWNLVEFSNCGNNE